MLRVVSNSVPTPARVTGNGEVRSQGQTPKVRPNHLDKPGKGKAGRVNESEPLMRRRHSRSPSEMMLAVASGDIGLVHSILLLEWQGHGSPTSVSGTPRPRRTKGTHPSRISLLRNVEIPMRSGWWSIRPVSQSQERPNSSVGTGRSKKRTPAAERHGEYITRWIGQYPTRKGADVDLVSHPKTDVQIANPRKS